MFVSIIHTHTQILKIDADVFSSHPPPTHLSDLTSLCSPLCSPPRPPCYSLNMPNTLLPPGLSTCSSSSVEHSSPRIPIALTLSPPLGLIKCHLLRQISPNTVLFNTVNCSISSHPPLISLPNTYHPPTCILLTYLHIVYLPPGEHKLHEGRDFWVLWLYPHS